MKRDLEATATLRADLASVTAVMRDPDDVLGRRGRNAGTYVTEMVADLHDGTTIHQKVIVELGLLDELEAGVNCRLAWRPEGHDRFLPAFEGSLEAEGDGTGGTALLISGTYQPPLGPVGALADSFALQHVARRTLVQFTRGLAGAIDVAVDERRGKVWATAGLPDDLRPMPSEHWLG
jgi:hypothetical protein